MLISNLNYLLFFGQCLSSSDAATFEDWLRGQITPICGSSEAKFVDNYVLSLEYLYTWQAFLNNKAARLPTLVTEISRHNVFMAPQFGAALRAAETQTMASYNNFLAQGNLSINETVEAANAKVFINAHYFMDEIVWEPGKILIATANTNQARAFECSAQVIPDFTKFIEESFNLGIQCTNNFFVNYDEAFTYIKRADIKLVNSNFYIRRCTNRSFAEIAPCLNQVGSRKLKISVAI